MQWIEKLEKNGFVQFLDFLSEQQARSYRKKLLSANHHKTWCLLTTPYRPCTRIKDNINKNSIDKYRYKQAVAARKRHQFSFSFYRSNNAHDNCHGAADIHQSFSREVVDRVSLPLGLSGDLRDTFFASFVKGQFIEYHSDGKAGKYAFVYQLSSGWQKKYGGQLTLYPRKIKFYRKIIEPRFNSLTLLKLDHPMYHSVQLLNNPKHKHRITLSGWLE
ncbi:MAG: SM-20-related protein [Alteromonadaceae bacterium]|jgi:SM-20-related protein